MEPNVAARLFTIAEANALIPKLELIMARLQQQTFFLRQEIESLAQQTGQAVQNLPAERILELRPELHQVIDEVHGLLREIDAHGVQFKGLDLGLIDFPAEIEGERALLCWQYGEKELGYYHSPEGGFASRKPLYPQPRRNYLQ